MDIDTTAGPEWHRWIPTQANGVAADCGLIYPVFCGATVVLLARWDPFTVMAAIERYRVKRTFMVVDNAVELMNIRR